MVHAIALSSLPVDEAADVVQEVFLKALRELKRLRDVAAFGGWIAAIARHAVVDVQRRRLTRPMPRSAPARHHSTTNSKRAAPFRSCARCRAPIANRY